MVGCRILKHGLREARAGKKRRKIKVEIKHEINVK